MIHRAALVLKEVKWWSVCTDWQICCLELRLVQLVGSEPGKHPFCSPNILCPTYISQLLFHPEAIAACNCTPPPRRTQASTQVHPSILQSPQMSTGYRMPPHPQIPNFQPLYFLCVMLIMQPKPGVGSATDFTPHQLFASFCLDLALKRDL